MMKSGDHAIVDEWLKTWPEDARNAIVESIPDYQHTVKLRTSTKNPTIKKPLDASFQLIINYNYYKQCFIIWNAAIQTHIHTGKKIKPSLGAVGENLLSDSMKPDSIVPFYREIGRGGSNIVELVLIVGSGAFPNFCKEYKDFIRPDSTAIPKGKICLYSEANGEIEYIHGNAGI